jgi:hypothetical protein
LLETAGSSSETTVVLDVNSERRTLADIDLALDLGIGTLEKLAAEVEVDEIEPGAPLIGFELFEGDGHLLAAILFVGIDITAEVVVKLDEGFQAFLVGDFPDLY